MAKKKSTEKPQRHMSKRALSSIKRQQRRQRFIFWGGVLVIVAVIAISMVGVIGEEVMPYHQTVVKVYDREFNARYLMDTVEYVGRLYSAEYYQYYLSSLVYSAPNTIVEAELVKRGAEELGITVAEEDVIERLEENELAVNDASIDLARVSSMSDRLLEEYFAPQLPEAADQVDIVAMFLESESQVADVTAELAAGGDFTELAGEYSLEYYTLAQQGELGWGSREYLEYEIDTAVPVDYAFDAEIGALSPPLYDEEVTKLVGYWLVNVLEREEDNTEAHIQVILLGSQEEADAVLLRLIDGEDFGELAQELSQHETTCENGGDMDWVTPDSLTDTLAAYVFDTELVEDTGITGPLRDEGTSTTGGYWLVQVVDREENRPLEEAEKEYRKNEAYSDWVTQLWEDATDEIDQSYFDAEIIEWIVDKLTEE